MNVVPHLTADQQAAVEALVAAAARADGVRALDEQATLHLAAGATHLLAGDVRAPTGYAHLETPDGDHTSGDASGDVVVHPDHRRHGLGRALADRMVAEAAGRPVQVWAHGPHPAAERLAAATGFEPVRTLLWMRRPLAGSDAALPDVRVPEGVTIRTFETGRDEDAWLALNAEAFATHPEQGTWTRSDLDARTSAPWFDPAGFFLAERAGKLVGFHWTKVHQGEVRGGRGPVGEIYVLGLAPSAQGTGLAKALAVTGLRHLRDRGPHSVMLYVEADNRPAIGLYERLDFATAAADVMYRHPGEAPA